MCEYGMSIMIILYGVHSHDLRTEYVKDMLLFIHHAVFSLAFGDI